MTVSLPAMAEVAQDCRDLGVGLGASELHGSLCGWLSGGGAQGPGWLGRVLVDEDFPAPAAGSALERLRQASAMQLEDRDFGFDLLLPDAAAPLHARSEALFDWCRGFVGGFGLAAGAEPGLSEEGVEALADLARLAAAATETEGDEDDEAAYAEIEEFVRIAALLLHGDCAMGRRHRQRLN